jgi:hypothetical protein
MFHATVQRFEIVINRHCRVIGEEVQREKLNRRREMIPIGMFRAGPLNGRVHDPDYHRRIEIRPR